MSDKTYAPSADFTANAHVDAAKYDEMYAASIKDPEAFWGGSTASVSTGSSLTPR